MTPHAIRVRPTNAPEDGSADRLFPSEGQVRCSVQPEHIADFDGISVVRNLVAKTGLPEPEQGVIFIVSTLAAQYAAEQGRKDFVSPDTGSTAIRENGQVVAVRGFQTFARIVHSGPNQTAIRPRTH